MYKVGIDIGSTTIKCIVLDQTNSIIFKEYKRHNARIKELTIEYLEKISALLPEQKCSIAITGSAGMGLAESYHLPFVQEVIATQVSTQFVFPNVDVVIELGGEDAKILFLSGGTEVRMNGSCAGGTGAFIDQMNVLLDTDLNAFDELALKASKIYQIASRCGVFAKSDIQPLLNQGVPKEDIAMSIFYAVANQTVAGLAQGRKIKGNVIFLGGPLTYMKGLQKAFQETLKANECNFIFPENAQYYTALGAAYYAENTDDRNLNELLTSLKTAKHKVVNVSSRMEPLFNSKDEYEAFIKRHNSDKVVRKSLNQYQGQVYLGIDAGSTTLKVVIMGENGELLYDHYQANKGNPVKILHKILQNIYAEKPDIMIAASAVTGYGEELIKNAFKLDFGIVETMAHLMAARSFMPDVDFIIDIGGQDMKCFKIKQGSIDTIFLNEACSSGCGSFISTFATAWGYDVAEFSKLGLFAKHPVDLGSRCTVFMNSSVKQAQKEGATIEDISAGLSISVVKNALYKVIRAYSAEKLGKHIVVQGGTFYNDAILRAFEKEINGRVTRPNISGLMGAYGCALFARKNHKNNLSTILSPSELEIFSYEVEQRQCDLCGNHCQLTINTFSDSRQMISGNRCERPLAHNKEKYHKEKLPNAFEYKRQLINKIKTHSKVKNPRGKIGIPLGLNMYELYPFWSAFWHELDFDVVFSPFSSHQLYQKGQQTIPSDTVCYPAKLMHGHIAYLLERKVDYIFYPCLTYNFDEDISDNHYNCPVVAYYPQVLEANMQDLAKTNYLYPFYGLHNKSYFRKQITKDLKKRFGLSSLQIRKAVNSAYEAQAAYRESVQKFCKKAIQFARKNNKEIVVLAGRPYHIDPEVNHGIDQLICDSKAIVISEDGLPQLKEDKHTKVLNQWTYHARLYNAAKYVSTQEDMHLVQLISFGCGLDAITADETREIIENAGDIYTQIKIDEISNLGAVKIRLRSLFATIEERKKNRGF